MPSEGTDGMVRSIGRTSILIDTRTGNEATAKADVEPVPYVGMWLCYLNSKWHVHPNEHENPHRLERKKPHKG